MLSDKHNKEMAKATGLSVFFTDSCHFILRYAFSPTKAATIYVSC